ncbi:MAG TPA: hypothetical protein VI485_03230 [Vicinamibacterales bacterium]|nr:hypothetical protein [Vicinamibacterales bacterium]
MTTIPIRALVVGVLTFAAVAAGAAQQTGTSDLLTATQVRDLAAKGSTPAEHAQLRDHFTALANQYEAEAKRHATMAKLPGNPNRRSGSDYATHWTRLSESVGAMAKTARELATFHGQLATGQPATRPADPSHLEHGTGAATVMSDAQLQQLVTSARTPADHGKLVEYFTSLVTKYSKDADSHAAMAVGYRGNPRGMTSAVAHCDRLVQQGRTAATEAKALAAEHQAMAK